jgi:SAM-dependent MidA family methyltransferase
VSLQQIIHAEIADRGPIDFARYMDLALYHPELGYYASGLPRTGWAGQFVTSPELDPAFGHLWAAGFEQIWESCGRPPTFTLIEVGPGEGSFSAAVLSAAEGDFAAALNVVLVERVDAVRRRQQTALDGFANVSWISRLDDMDSTQWGCLFANEVIDNMPVRLAENRGGTLVELRVGVRNSALELVPGPPSEEILRFIDGMAAPPADGHRAEIPLAAGAFASRAATTIHSGATVLVDYGDHESGLVERPAGTLLCYSDSGVDDRFLEHPGAKDITAHANWSALARACQEAGASVAGPKLQREVLKALGIDELQDHLRAHANEALRNGSGAAGVRSLSRRGALGTLVDRAGLGGLGVLVAHMGIPAPKFMAPPR